MPCKNLLASSSLHHLGNLFNARHLEDEHDRDNEGVDDQRLDECEAENHWAVQLACCPRITGDTFEGGGGCSTLTDTPTSGSQTDGQTRADGNVGEVIGDCTTGMVTRECRECNESNCERSSKTERMRFM